MCVCCAVCYVVSIFFQIEFRVPLTARPSPPHRQAIALDGSQLRGAVGAARAGHRSGGMNLTSRWSVGHALAGSGQRAQRASQEGVALGPDSATLLRRLEDPHSGPSVPPPAAQAPPPKERPNCGPQEIAGLYYVDTMP